MIQISKENQAVEAKYEIERALLGGESWILFDGDEPVAALLHNEFALSVEWGKLIFAWWSEDRAQNFKVIGYRIDSAVLTMQVTRGMARQISTLILREAGVAPGASQQTKIALADWRSDYPSQLVRLLTSNLSRVRVQKATSGPDPARSVPGRYARLVLSVNNERALAIGVNHAESQATIDGVIAAGLIWLMRYNEVRALEKQARLLWFCLPRDRDQTVLERLALIDLSHLGARIECFEIDDQLETLLPAQPATQAELLKTHPRELRWPITSEANRSRNVWHERIMSLAPDVIEARPLLDGHGISFSIHGLEFARASNGAQPRINFGLIENNAETGKSAQRTLSESNFDELNRLVRLIIELRTARTSDRGHAFYRLRSEAWLESLLRRCITDLDQSLDERYVFSQIPAWRSNERSVIDLLTIDLERRLVVIEIKAAEDLQLPLQGLDYWLRVEQARVLGEFEHRGLFAGVKLADRSPLLYLVAPRLRFHRTFKSIARCLSPEIEAYQIGVNTNWRAGVRIHSKERLNSSD